MKSFTQRFLFICFAVSLFIAPTVHAADPVGILHKDLEKIFSAPRFSDAQWGAKVLSLDRSELLFEKNARRLYIPASNTKILTTAAALLRLGPSYRFKTQIQADGPIVNGILKGNLIIAGFGDPSSSSRIGAKDPFEAFRNWASRLKALGIRSIAGNLVGDDSAFEEISYGRGWAWDDLAEGYAAPASALQFNENLMVLNIAPGSQAGTPAALTTEPLRDYLTVNSRVSTKASGNSASIEIEHARLAETVRVRGTISIKSPVISRSVAVQLPIRYYLSALKYILTEEGIDTSNCQIEDSRNGFPSGKLLWTHMSAPLSDLLPPTLKLSLNLMSETLLRTLGLEFRGEGSYAKGKEVVQETLAGMGINPEGYSYADASGLSRLNLVTTDMMVKILTAMYRNPNFPLFHSSLSIAGVDGTLKARMTDTRAENNVHAKTGTLSNVSAISGYVRTAEGEMLAFSMIANNFLTSKDVAERLQDKVLERLANFSRKAGGHRRSSITPKRKTAAKD